MNPHAIQRRPANASNTSAKAASRPDAADAEAALRQFHAGTAPATPTLAAGQVLLEAGAFTEDIWRVNSNALRLDLLGEGNEHSVQSALQGEHVVMDAVHGMPTLAGGRRLSDDGRTAIELPCLAHIAAIVDIAPETGSRILGHRRRQGLPQGEGAGPELLDGRRMAALAISTAITQSAVRDAAAPVHGAALVRSRS